jgi:predicted PurR-regulated permease PerM
MIDKELKLPLYAKATIFIIGLFALFAILYLSKGIVIPIVFAIIIAIALHPLVNFLGRIGINRVLAIVITLLLTLTVIGAFGALLFSEAIRFGESFPILVDKFTLTLHQTIAEASDYFNINQQNINDWIAKTKVELIDKSSALIGKTLLNIGGQLVVLFLIPVYIFMILFYQPLLLEFIRRLFGINHKLKVNEIITQTKKLIQSYIIGLLVEASIVAFLYSIGLLIIGIDYAILLGFLAAVLNIVPYIGGLVALTIIMIITIATKNSFSYPIMVGILAILIHLIDNSFIIPKIVASKVKVNALISITAIIAANALLGIPGMIICIPVIGIIKLIFDHIEPLKPWGFLLGDTMPPILNIKPLRLWRIKK